MDHGNPNAVIADEAMFRDAYIPEKLFARETQMQEISRCLAPAVRRRKPMHIWLYGSHGAGKSVIAANTLNNLKARARIGTVHVNCWENDTCFEVLDSIVSELRILRADEHRTSAKLERLRAYIRDQPFVIVLDDADRMANGELGMAIQHLDSLGNVGVICISQDSGAVFDLDSRAASRLSPRLVMYAGRCTS